MCKYKIALIQMESEFLDLKKNLLKAEKYIEEAVKNNANLICFPESFNIGYDGSQIEEMKKHAEKESGTTLNSMKILAKKLKVHLLIPIYYLNENSEVENRAFLIDDEGEIIGSVAKTHPVGDERYLLARGTQYPVFETKLGKIGIVICYDVCFPETTRMLALKGAEIILVPAAWRGNYYFKEWWDINISCRALDNLLYVAAVNTIGDCGDQYFAGKSQICNPIGTRISNAEVDEEVIVYGDIDIDTIVKRREFNTIFQDRHPEDYNFISDLRGVL